MKTIWIVTRKELQELVSERNTMLITLFMTLFFSVIYSFGAARNSSTADATGGVVLFLSSAIGVFMAYMLTGRVFLREKMDRVIETIMCAPVGIRELWAGKTLSVTLLSWGLTLLGTVVMLVITGSVAGASSIIPILLFHVLIVIPVLIFAFVGILGFAQFFLGMRENRIINMLIFVPVFGGLYGVGYGMGGAIVVSWPVIGIVFAIALFLVLVATFLLRYLSKERIVKTLS
jgi:ABC-2 type transport system permease protein